MGLGVKPVMALFPSPDEEELHNSRLFTRFRHSSSTAIALSETMLALPTIATVLPVLRGTTIIDT
jgi:hypothetical protein